MPDKQFPVDGELWIFALDIYARENVATACLALQELIGTDVNLLLFGAWIGAERGIILNQKSVSVLNELVSSWREDVVRPLRLIRQKLKQAEFLGFTDEINILRNEVKKLEQRGEQLELARLEHHAASWRTHEEVIPAEAVETNLRMIVAAEHDLMPVSGYVRVIGDAAIEWSRQKKL